MDAQLLTPRYVHALELVAMLFDGYKRKISGVPYVTHLYGVAHILQEVSDDEDVCIAGLLHDVIEDISSDVYAADQLEADFGVRVREMVETVSHDEELYGKDEARQRYLNQIESGSLEACLVSAADLLYNATDIVRNFAADPEKVGEAMGGKSAQRRDWFWQERHQILRKRLGDTHVLIKELNGVMERLGAIHQEIM